MNTKSGSSLLSILVGALALAFLLLLAAVPLTWKEQSLLSGGLILFAFLMNRRSKSKTITIQLTLLSVFCTLRYIYWRYVQTWGSLSASGWKANPIDLFFVFLLLGAETYAVVILLLGYLQTARPLLRKPACMPSDAATWPVVDVLVPTYNEPLSVVRPTILAALAMDWPADRMRVFVLDDGTRPEFAQFAAECGAGYVIRSEHRHAKAGNINNALAQIGGEYVAIFDSDHIPTRSFLQMTVGWFLRDAQLGMLQTPHHFYSPDPFERNLGIFREVPNEGALFYGVVQDGNDFWNASFFCGSCAVIRREALDQVGGVAVETVTEDAHTSLRLQRKGWNTAYISIPQAAGLATARLADHIGQRIRWARGMVQILRVDNPLFASGMSLAQRLCYFNAVAHFLYGLPRLVFLTAPLVYLILGRSNLYGYLLAILAYAVPHLVLATVTNSRVQGKHRFSFWNELYETVLAPYILMPTLLALVNPRWGKFNVTSKDSSIENDLFDWKIARPYLVLVALNLVGIGMAVPGVWASVASGSRPSGTLLINLFWALCNTLLLGGALAVAAEKRQMRSSVRIITAQIALRLRLEDGTALEAVTRNISMGGACVQLATAARLSKGEMATATFSGGGEIGLPVTVVGTQAGSVRIQFAPLDLEQLKALTSILYSRADTWLGWKQSAEDDRPIHSLKQIVRIAIGGLAGVVTAAFRGSGTSVPLAKPLPRRQAVVPVVMLGLLLLLIFALRSPAAEKDSLPKFVETQTFASLGRKQPLMLRGLDGQESINFGIPITKMVGEAMLTLRIRPSAALIPEVSRLEVTLNGTELGSLGITQPQPGTAAVSMTLPVPADLLISENNLTFHLAGRCSPGCVQTHLATQVELSSELKLSGTVLPLPNDLRLLPFPFFDPAVGRTVDLPIVFATPPDARTLQAAGVVASAFGALADHRGIRFPASIGAIPPGNVVFIVSGNSPAAASLGIEAVRGPAIAIRNNPNDRYGKVLAILGGDGTQALAAAGAFALRDFPKSGDRADLTSFETPVPRKPYDAPRWVNLEHSAGLGEVSTPEQLRVSGSGSVNLYFHLPPDLNYGLRTVVPLKLNFRCTRTPSAGTAELRVKLNGVSIGTRPIRPDNTDRIRTETIAAPVASLFQNNTLTVEFAFERTNGSVSEEDLPESSVLPSSQFDLHGIPRFVSMPKLELFANSGFPFTRMADLSETAVVLPRNADLDDISLYLAVLGNLGAQTGYPGLRVSVLDADQALQTRDKDLLILGNTRNQDLLKRWAEDMPMLVEDNRMRLVADSHWWSLPVDLPWTAQANYGRRAAAELKSEAPFTAAIEEFPSPVASGRTAVAIVTPGRADADPFIEFVSGAREASEVFGGLSVLQNGHFHSVRVGEGSYHLGYLGWYDYAMFNGRQYYWALPFLIAFVTWFLARPIDRWLERRAVLRLQVGR